MDLNLRILSSYFHHTFTIHLYSMDRVHDTVKNGISYCWGGQQPCHTSWTTRHLSVRSNQPRKKEEDNNENSSNKTKDSRDLSYLLRYDMTYTFETGRWRSVENFVH